MFLMDEWKQKKESELHFYTNLVSFLKDHVQDVELENEQKKEELIDSLRESYNFLTTHAIVAEMSKIKDWSMQQIDDLCTIAVNNLQVRGIIKDEDI